MGAAGSISNGPIRDRFENNYSKRRDDYLYNIYRKKIINFSDTRKGDLNINLIHYDKNLKKEENFEYYRYFSIKVLGSYCSFDDYDMLKLFLSRQLQIPFSPNYVLIISGTESEKLLKEFHNYDFINDIIIFCFEKNNYLDLKKAYNKSITYGISIKRPP